MDYEKKYKDALADIQELYNSMKYMSSTDALHTTTVLERAFPELKESEDEKIKEQVIYAINQLRVCECTKNKLLSWLEKQGEQKQDPCEKCDHFTLNCHNFPCIEKETFDQGKSALEAINEEKIDNVNKVEPKFKVGDWVVRGNITAQILDIQEQYYIGIDTNGNDFTSSRFLSDDKIHLWTIEDARDGDVLVASDGSIFIFKEVDYNSCKHYIALTADKVIKVNVGLKHYWETARGVQPATKEQHDLLFQRMKEAGYEWDAENKELKKIHVITPRFNVGDTIIKKRNSDIRDFGSFTITDITGGKYWYNDRIICNITEQDEWELYEPVTWSEEDEAALGDALWCCKQAASIAKNENDMGNIWYAEKWLKSIKERMKGD